MKKQNPIAEKLEANIRSRLVEKKNSLGISDDALGRNTFAPLGYEDFQKKVNNLLRGKKPMGIAEFYILCDGLGLHPDRLFTSALDDALASPPLQNLVEASRDREMKAAKCHAIGGKTSSTFINEAGDKN